MKTTSSRSALVTFAATLALGAFAATTFAGPGPQYWNKAPAAPASAIATASTTATTAFCADAQVVTKMELQPGLANGRSTPHAVQSGTSISCTSCAGLASIEKAGWPNGRGPLAPVAVKASHDCRTGCVIVAGF